DARQAGQITEARKLALSCAQSACPSLIQADCSRIAEDLERMQPTLSFAARDSAERDLPDTTVYVDGALVTSKLADGKTYEVDPGPHKCLFIHADREIVSNVVVSQGEKARPIVVTFANLAEPSKRALHQEVAAGSRPVAPIVVATFGGAAIVAGAV